MITHQQILDFHAALVKKVVEREPDADVTLGTSQSIDGAHYVVQITLRGDTECYMIDPRLDTWVLAYGHF